MSKSIGEQVRENWARLQGKPGGKQLFSWMIGRMAPYTGTVGGVVQELEPGYAKVELKDRRRVRNHLRSVHAIALANLGEMATGLAMMSGLPEDGRGILTGIDMRYLKKARGTLTAECRCEIPSTVERQEYRVVGEIRDASGELVATATALWLIGPRKERTDATDQAAK